MSTLEEVLTAIIISYTCYTCMLNKMHGNDSGLLDGFEVSHNSFGVFADSKICYGDLPLKRAAFLRVD